MIAPARLSAVLAASISLAAAAPPAGPGTPFPASRSAAPQVAAAAKASLAKELDGMAAEYRQVDLDVGRRTVFVEAFSGAVCGNEVGCPHVILVRSGTGWRLLWKGMATGPGKVMEETHGGMRDIALRGAHVDRRLEFDGNAYREAVLP